MLSGPRGPRPGNSRKTEVNTGGVFVCAHILSMFVKAGILIISCECVEASICHISEFW